MACLFQLKVEFVLFAVTILQFVEDEGLEPSMKFLSLASKASAMPLGESSVFVGVTGVEPAASCSQNKRLTSRLHPDLKIQHIK